jgi:hypothetical protein
LRESLNRTNKPKPISNLSIISNKRGRLQASAIEGWKLRIKELIKHFQEISFQHIFREYNKEADLLSKQALQEPEGRITYYKWENGTEGPKRHLILF